MKKLRVTVDGKVFDVTVEVLDEGTPTAIARPVVALPAVAPAPVVSAPVAPAAAPAASAGAGAVISPLAGKVVSVDVAVGQTVAQGAQILTLEAMKMNTHVYAPKAGKVTLAHVKPGDAVEEGAPLLTID
jgi:biotin carboxyl carrier protein